MPIAEAHDFQLPITSESTLREFVELAWGVSVPDVKVCEHHTTPWRAFADAYFSRYPVTVWHGSRGFAGKSFTLALLSMTEAVTLGAEVNVLGGSGEQSKRVLEHMQNLWRYESAPRGMLLSDAATTTKLSNGAKVQALMASQASVRGPHPQRLRLDEIDEMALPILDASMGQPMSKNGVAAQTVMSSTRQYSDGTMQEILQRAQQKGWGVFEWCVHSESVIMSPVKDKRIIDISIGDVIYAYHEGRVIETKVSDVWSNGDREAIAIRCRDGRSVICTPEHRVLTEGGWKNAGSLLRGEVLFGVRKISREARKGKQESYRHVSGLQKREEKISFSSRELSAVWKPKATIFKTLFEMLSIRDDEEEFSGRRASCQCERETCAFDKEQHKQIGKGGERDFGLSRYSIRGGSSIWAVLGGLRDSLKKDLRGSERSILAFKTGSNGAGRVEGEDCGGFGLSDGSFNGRPVAFLDSAIVERVEYYGSIDVWDLTVEDGGSFVCDGIVVHNCWRETLEPHGWLRQSDVDQKRNEVTAAMWQTEYDNQEPNPSSRAIQPGAVEKMFDRSLGEFEGAAHEYIEIEPPVAGAQYATGADWARKSDWTIIVTFRVDCEPVRCVAWERTGRLDWPVMLGKLDARLLRYGGQAHHDGTGIGDVVSGYLTQPATAVIMAGRPRAKMLSDYAAMCEKGSIIYPFIRWAYQEHKFASVEAVFGSGEHLPDSISAGALGMIDDVEWLI